MQFIRYYGQVLYMALRHSLATAEAAVFVLGIAIGSTALVFPEVAMAIHFSEWQIAAASLGMIVGLRLVLAPYWIYMEEKAKLEQLDEEKKRLDEKLKHDKPNQAALDGLGDLLSEGISKILNGQVTNPEQLRKFIEISESWDKRLFEHLDKNFPKSDALLVQRLGTIQPRSFPHARFDEQNRILSHFSRREEMMRELIKRGPHK